MRLNRRFYFLTASACFVFLLWILLFDDLLLGIWLGLVLLLFISFILSRISLAGVEVKRISRIKNQEIGGIFEERLEIRNNSKIVKLWLEVIDHSIILSKISSRVITGLGKNKVGLFSSTIILNKRGFFQLGPTQVISGDPFGIFTASKFFQHSNYLIVFPKIFNINGFPLLPSAELGEVTLRTQTTNTTPQAAGVREFFPGDPLNRVHWPTTLKRNKLMVKEFDEDTQSSVWIFLDSMIGIYWHEELSEPPSFDRNFAPLSRSPKYQLPRDSYEYAVSISATIADFFLRRNRLVGFASAGNVSYIIPADKGQRQLAKILEKLAVIKGEGKLPLSQLIEKQIRNIPRGSSLILITPAIDEHIESLLETQRRKGYRSIIILIQNDTFKNNENYRSELGEKKMPNKIIVSFGDNLETVLSNN